MRKMICLLLFVLLVAACTPTPTPTPTSTPVPTSTPSLTPTPAPVSCDLTAISPVTIYMRASASADQFGTLGSQTVQPTARTADGFYGFDPGVAQAGNVGLFRLRWVLKTHAVTTSPGCASLPLVVAPISGICYVMIMDDSPVFSSADTGSPVVVTLHLNDYAMVVGSSTGWYTLDLNVSTAGLDALGYLQDSHLGGFSGPCEGF